jgi:hypothetical protein
MTTPKEGLRDEDIWGDSDDEIQSKDQQETPDMAKLRRTHHKQGYLDGITWAKEQHLQKGFDTGYPEGAQLALRVGKIIGTLQCLSVVDDDKTKEAKELLQRAKKELHISKVLSWRYFNEELDLSKDGHALLIDWEKLVDDLQYRK